MLSGGGRRRFFHDIRHSLPDFTSWYHHFSTFTEFTVGYTDWFSDDAAVVDVD
jgi:hypothetical protein